MDAAKKELTRLERVVAQAGKPQHCPGCNIPLRVVDGLITADTTDRSALEETQAEARKAKKQFDKHSAAITKITQAIREPEEALRKVESDLAVAAKLAEGAGKKPNTQHAATLAEAEAEVEQAKTVVKVIQSARSAHSIHETIVRYSECARSIGPQGVRQRMLSQGLARLNAGLQVLSETTGWPLMLADEKGGLSWNGRPAQLCSESEKWRAQASMQLTLAALTGSRIVVLGSSRLAGPCGSGRADQGGNPSHGIEALD